MNWISFADFCRGVATPSAEAQRRASARLASALEEATGREQAARLHQGRRRWRAVALAAVILVGAALLVTPALGIGDRLLSLIQGKPTPLDVQAPAWSRDGRTIVFVSWRDGNGEVYAMDADGSSPRNLTQDPAKDAGPAWSPDGRQHRVRKPARRQLRGLRHERRREREAEPHAKIGRTTTTQPGHPTGGGSRSCVAVCTAIRGPAATCAGGTSTTSMS